MDVSITTTKASCHGRSNSLPSKSHPFIVSVEDQLQGSRSSEAASSSPFLSAKTWLHLRICLNVWSLVSKLIQSKPVSSEEEENGEDMINLESVLCALIKNKSSKAINVMQVQKAQKVLEAMESTMKEIEEGLESVFRVLDICGSSKEILSQMKESHQNFESSVRRKRPETGFANEIANYIKSRKNINEWLCKVLRNLKATEKKTAQNFLTKTAIFSPLLACYEKLKI
ncbi:putative Eukaryotic translation initiation factor 3 subunit A [Melia azedarach]|uniref:Eukaryotic translation initiation factor 3 subunit A n=1 Tax=Melia azedarach TaxID=155640 RepID=A0ACC1WSX8_MELAZ|nr:putative Eukaryotic translation initiation factor 3 subunit A [Melia azedarach]